MKRCVTILGAVLCLAFNAYGQTTAFTFEVPSEGVESVSGSDGFRFNTSTDIQVTDLGYYDHDGDGLKLNHTVGLFDFDSQELLVSADVNDTSFLNGAFRYTAIEPFTLNAGTMYLIAGHHPGTNADDPAVELLGESMVTDAPEVRLFEYFFDESEELLFPRTSFDPFRFFGPNFRYVLSGDISEIDFNGDGQATCTDINSLANAVANELPSVGFDLNNDLQLDISDVELWLLRAGAANGGSALSNGDANLDGSVDAADQAMWASNRFTDGTWCSGDFNADGHIDGSDFNVWNDAAQAAATSAVPEPGSTSLALLGLLSLFAMSRSTLGR